MITFIYGNISDIKKKYEIGKYIEDIVEYINKPISLFETHKYNSIYFLYDKNTSIFAQKSDIEKFINICTQKDISIYCIIESIDKKTVFYKTIKNILIDIHIETNIKDIAKQFRKNISVINQIDDNSFVSFLYTLYYSNIYKEISGHIINYILTGKFNTHTARKFFLAYITT